MQLSDERIIEQTKKWITDVVIGCNFCPFAAKEVARNKIRYRVEKSPESKACLACFLKACIALDNEEDIETILLILPNGFAKFDDYLKLLKRAEKLLKKEGYEGIYQVASFHPVYQFAGSPANDPANYTNRSVYPMLHILREAGIESALNRYPNPGQIPKRNINFAREKGVAYMKTLLNACL
jgi:hypothetical protein